MNNYFEGIEFGDKRRKNEDIKVVKKRLSILKKIDKLKERRLKNPKAMVNNILPISMKIDDAIKYYESKLPSHLR